MSVRLHRNGISQNRPVSGYGGIGYLPTRACALRDFFHASLRSRNNVVTKQRSFSPPLPATSSLIPFQKRLLVVKHGMVNCSATCCSFLEDQIEGIILLRPTCGDGRIWCMKSKYIGKITLRWFREAWLMNIASQRKQEELDR